MYSFSSLHNITQQREAKNEHIERTAANAKLFTPTFVQTNVEGGQYEEIFRDGSSTAATCKMEIFVIIVNDFQPLTIITKCSILDRAAVLHPPLTFLIISFDNTGLVDFTMESNTNRSMDLANMFIRDM